MDLIALMEKVIALNKIKRTIWLYKNVPNPESIADHCFGVISLALFVPIPKDINRDELVKMAIVHDLGDAFLGDIAWESSKPTYTVTHSKKQQEKGQILKELFGEEEHKELLRLSTEFMKQSTKTAKFLRELSKLEMSFRALDYEKVVNPGVMDDVWESCAEGIKTPALVEIFNTLKGKRSR